MKKEYWILETKRDKSGTPYYFKGSGNTKNPMEAVRYNTKLPNGRGYSLEEALNVLTLNGKLKKLVIDFEVKDVEKED